jgi:microcompartment protein CcmL/EutN
LSKRVPKGPALALLELDSIARGFIVADALLKRAQVDIVVAEPVTPGKYLLLFTGEVADVEESMKAGEERAANTVIDTLYLPGAHRRVLDALGEVYRKGDGRESFGVIETQTAASAIKAADVAMKRADVVLTHLHLAKGVGGKGWFTLSGDLHMIEAALDAVQATVTAPLLLATELIQSPHPELRGRVI